MIASHHKKPVGSDIWTRHSRRRRRVEVKVGGI